MRTAFVADVHSNLQALEAVLAHAGRPGVRAVAAAEARCSCGAATTSVDRVFHVGDLVGYGADPGGVVELVADLGIEGVVGNHDWAALRGGHVPFNPVAYAALEHTRRVLDDGARKHLADLPERRRLAFGGTELTLVHGSPADPLWEYVFPENAPRILSGFAAEVRAQERASSAAGPASRVLVLGHTHVPVAERIPAGTVGLPRVALYNPGSVGQPRDGDPRASFLVLDTETGDAELHRVYYDIRGAARAIRQAGLPTMLAERLFAGR